MPNSRAEGNVGFLKTDSQLLDDRLSDLRYSVAKGSLLFEEIASDHRGFLFVAGVGADELSSQAGA